jgi:Transposase and inactivated derivatives
MRFVGIDYHKRYSVCCATDERGQSVRERRINGNSAAGFAQFFSELGEPARVVMEACWNWGWLYDLLGETPGVEEVVLAHPYKTRLIAEAQIKTDRIDARVLAKLLRGDLVAQSHAPGPATRQRKQLLRQRLFWVRLRTMLRNRTHAILDRQRGLERPQLNDLFGRRGQSWLHAVRLPTEGDQPLLVQDLEVMELLEAKIKELDRLIGQSQGDEEKLLESLPGIGPVFSSVIATEIDGVARFGTPAKLCAYAGVVPTTHASGGRVYQGRLLWQCNKWLRWALVEASWSAIQFSGYFGGIYRAARDRGKNKNVAITCVAHHLCRIIWLLLTEKRPYTEAFPDRSEPQMTVAARPVRTRLASRR